LFNVLVTKMVTDWFAEHRIATAMGILISSWPLGIAIALLIMGPLEGMIGLKLTFFIPVVLCVIALLLIALIYRAPPRPVDGDRASDASLSGRFTAYEFRGVVLAGCVWAFYNIAFILLLSFGPEYLISRGVELGSAGAIVSLTSWFFIPALPLGAWMAERSGRPLATLVVILMAIAVLILMVPFIPWHTVMFIMLGIVFAPAGGLIMALPAQVLSKENRAVGMGIFFTIYYVGMGVFPVIAGYALDLTGNPVAPLILASVVILLAIVALAGFRLNQGRQAPSPLVS